MGWVVLLRLLQLGVLLQVPTITIGQAVLLREDIITHLAVLLQVATTTIGQPVLLQVVTTTIGPPALLQVATTTIGQAVLLLQEVIQFLQQAMAESPSLSG